MKKTMIYLMIIITVLILPNVIFAFDPNISASPKEPPEIGPMVSTILGVIQWFGYAIAIGMLIYIGVKYTMSAANEKADLKSASINFVIGAIIIAGASAICGWIATTFEEIDAEVSANLIPNTKIYKIV